MVSKLVPAPHVWTVAVPETAGVHWKTCSGEVKELPQLPTSALVPLVAPLKVPPCAGMTVGLVHAPPAGRVLVVVAVVVVVLVVVVVVVVVGSVVVVVGGVGVVAVGVGVLGAAVVPAPVV